MNDRLEPRSLARLQMFHPDRLVELANLGPASSALKRPVRRQAKLVADRLSCRQRLDSLLDLIGLGYVEVFSTRMQKAPWRSSSTTATRGPCTVSGCPGSASFCGAAVAAAGAPSTPPGCWLRPTSQFLFGKAAAWTSPNWPGTSPPRYGSFVSSGRGRPSRRRHRLALCFR